MYVRHKYSHDIFCSVTNDNLTYHALFGMLLVVTATVGASSLLLPGTIMVFAQEADGGDAAATMTSGANETAATPGNNMTGAEFLAIQGAQSGSVSEVNATTSTLELSNVSDTTILFSDRPYRILTSVNTTDFIGNWSMGTNSFAVDPPNAVLILDDDLKQRQDLAGIELYNPEYNSEASVLKYDIIAVNATSIPKYDIIAVNATSIPGEFGQSTLLIDPIHPFPP